MAKSDWQKIWATQNINLDEDKKRLEREKNTLRWRQIESTIKRELGDISKLKNVEVGAGLGDFSIIFNNLGASTTLADYSEEAISKARARFHAHGLDADYVLANMLIPNPELAGKFDISFSLGLAEHFSGEERLKIIAAHADVLRKGGLTFISIPYKYSFLYQFWMRMLIMRGNWQYGLEIPFSKKEIRDLAEKSGFETLGFIQSSFLGDWDRFYPKHRIAKLFKKHIEKPSVLNNYGYALVYVGKKI